MKICKHGDDAEDCKDCELESMNAQLASLTKELAAEKEQHACTIDVLAQTRTQLTEAQACIKGKDAALRYVLWNIKVPQQFYDQRIANAALKLTPSSDHLEAYVRERIGEPVAIYEGRRETPKGTREFWGLLSNKIDSMPRGTRLYAPSINPAVSDGGGG